MKKILLLTVAIVVVLGFSASNAEAGTRFSVSVSSGHGYHHGGYYAPAPVYYAPAPVYYAPRRVVYHQPRRVVYHQPRRVYSNQCYQPRRVHRGHVVSNGYYR